jgi:hypothetical protein
MAGLEKRAGPHLIAGMRKPPSRHAALAVAINLAGAAVAPAAARAQLPEPPALEQALMRDVAALAHDSMEGRRIGTAGAERARRYLVSALAASGARPLGAGWEHPFEERRDTLITRGVNLVASVRGTARPDSFIVLTAHYDHLGIRNGQVFNGADDNASGTAAVLALARAVAGRPLLNSVLFVLFDGEEGGLRGARAFVAAPPVPLERLLLNINLDMVGRNANHELFAAGTHPYPRFRPVLDSVAARSSVRLRFGHDVPGTGSDDWTTQSDHAAFHARRIPFIYFGVEDHPDYHRPTDDVERLMPAFYAGAVRTIYDALVSLDRSLAGR